MSFGARTWAKRAWAAKSYVPEAPAPDLSRAATLAAAGRKEGGLGCAIDFDLGDWCEPTLSALSVCGDAASISLSEGSLRRFGVGAVTVGSNWLLRTIASSSVGDLVVERHGADDVVLVHEIDEEGGSEPVGECHGVALALLVDAEPLRLVRLPRDTPRSRAWHGHTLRAVKEGVCRVAQLELVDPVTSTVRRSILVLGCVSPDARF
jgi:hypothetical protein